VSAIQELAARDRIRGEITLLVEALPQTGAKPGLAPASPASEKISDRVARLEAETGMDEKDALKHLARELGQSKSDLYRELQRERARLKNRGPQRQV
jgi:16S rRNA (cytidine1402-2'-O)-methyltransferase